MKINPRRGLNGQTNRQTDRQTDRQTLYTIHCKIEEYSVFYEKKTFLAIAICNINCNQIAIIYYSLCVNCESSHIQPRK